MKKLLMLFSTIFLLSSCEEEIDLVLDDKSGELVIEGSVTDQPGPYYVRVTRSVAFTEENKYPAIEDAIVVISDDSGQIDTLSYESNGNYRTDHLVSVPGRTYKLYVQVGALTYTAESKMPLPVALDGLKQDSLELAGNVSYTILPIFTDPPQLGNRYTFVLNVNESNKKTIQTFSDNTDNGVVNQRSIMPAVEDDDEDVKIGDVIRVEMRCVDQNVYTYYSALSQLLNNSGPGGGITPANPPSNISNGALGVFSAHSTATQSITIR